MQNLPSDVLKLASPIQATVTVTKLTHRGQVLMEFIHIAFEAKMIKNELLS